MDIITNPVVIGVAFGATTYYCLSFMNKNLSKEKQEKKQLKHLIITLIVTLIVIFIAFGCLDNVNTTNLVDTSNIMNYKFNTSSSSDPNIYQIQASTKYPDILLDI